MGAYKHNVVVVIKTGTYIHGAYYPNFYDVQLRLKLVIIQLPISKLYVTICCI